MKVLIIGGGGREHSLAWKLSQSLRPENVICAPGNAGIARDAQCFPVNPADSKAILELAIEQKPDITVVGPEQPLIDGLADDFRAHGLQVVGPSRNAARLEGSKIFAKQFLGRHAIPTGAVYGIFDDAGQAYDAISSIDGPLVIKADGPCAGKGVLVTNSREEARAFVKRLMEDKEFGDSGSSILLEEALQGEELSFIVLSDGQHILPLVPARDHKRALDGDQGPNTGGMGAFSAEGMISQDLEKEILQKVVRPTLDGMAREGSPYIGFLYCGLMLTGRGPEVLEFNCRMGDPECQAIVARMEFDLAEVLQAACRGELGHVNARWRSGASVCVVLASGGYPGHYETDKLIEGLEEAGRIPDVVVFHAATRMRDQGYRSAGGRVLGVTAVGPDLEAATRRAYQAAARIRFGGVYYRKDIAKYNKLTKRNNA
ncbi:MAG TPA: phosphoribosylamine--glycine ligase [Candidatus Dormibacteraeota bacterium]|nr:phosphoribosylamine--glycine ligase [Candidatus Dormibacteraeota bacterium]